MHLSTHPLIISIISLLPLAHAATSANPPPSLQTTYLHHNTPSTSSSPPQSHPLATLLYSPARPDLSRIESFTPPPNKSAEDALTNVLLYLDSADEPVRERYRSSLTATRGFHAPFKGRFRLLVTPEGQAIGASWHAWLPSSDLSAESAKKDVAKGRGKGDFDLIVQKMAPGVVFDAPTKAGTGKEGEEGEVVEEKSMLQKYWWVLVGVAILAMTGGGEK